MKSLFLVPETPTWVKLDGPSLVVLDPRFAPSRIPLGRVTHLVIGGAAQVDSRVLAACLRQGISVTLLDEHSSLGGVALPFNRSDEPLSRQIEQFLALPGHEPRYLDWLRSRERDSLLRALRTRDLQLDLSKCRDEDICAVWEARLKRRGPTLNEIRQWAAYDQALLAAQFAQFLGQAKVDPIILASGSILTPSHFTTTFRWLSYADIDWIAAKLGPRMVEFRRHWRLRIAQFAETRSVRNSRIIERFWSSFISMVRLTVHRSAFLGDQ